MYYGKEDQFWRVKKYLYQVQDAGRRAELLQRRIDLRDVIDSEYTPLREELERAETEKKKAEIEITDFVSQLYSVNQQMVVIKRYVDGESWEQIAEDMDMSVRAVQHLHGRALPLLKEMHMEMFPEEYEEVETTETPDE